MHFRYLVAAFVTITSAAAAPSHGNHVLHERRDGPMRSWAKRSRVTARSKLPMRIGLTQRNLDRAEELLMEVSQHDSPKFGQHYTHKQIDDLFAPTPETIEAVKFWLASAGVDVSVAGLSANKQWIAFEASAEEAEALLKTEYYLYTHTDTGKSSIACDEYHVPAHIQEHIDYITPGVKLLHPKPTRRSLDKRQILRKRDLIKRELAKREIEERGFRTGAAKAFSGPVLGTSNVTIINGTAQELAVCDQYITPVCIATMYNITKGDKALASNKLGIFEEGDYYAVEDLTLYWETFANYIPPTTVPELRGIDGGIAPFAAATGESDLDFTISYPILWPQTAALFQTDDYNYALGIEGGGGFLNTFLDALDGSYCQYTAFGETGDASIDPVYPDPLADGYQGTLMCGYYSPTNVISISYGEQEDDLPTNYQRRQCNEFMKLGLAGVSVVIASGDSGVAARSTDDGNSDGCLGANGQVFSPDFPASCPYVTALGATYLPSGANATGDHEVAVTRFPSGGGFSNIYPRPAYQNTTLNTYFKKYDPGYPYYSTQYNNNPNASVTGKGIYNRAGRGYPDFGAIGDNFVFFLDGTPELVGGTSASAPVFAAMLNRINEELLSLKYTTVGFVNPTLYANPSVLHDITVGNNSGCGTPGFYAKPGWDPVTGMGTLNYIKAMNLYKTLKKPKA